MGSTRQAGVRIKPGVQTPGNGKKRNKPVNTGDSFNSITRFTGYFIPLLKPGVAVDAFTTGFMLDTRLAG